MLHSCVESRCGFAQVYNQCKALAAGDSTEGASQNFFQGSGHHYDTAFPAYRPGGCRREHSGKMSVLLTVRDLYRILKSQYLGSPHGAGLKTPKPCCYYGFKPPDGGPH